ncbi:MAG: FAD-dependent oxidoreductase [candidate division Zixibacteria bacterium]|nr:FAD-dependent oxidoreductase [candidate division Zixibacteria bacterium]
MSATTELYNVAIPDLDYYLDLIACRKGCPVHTHAGRYVQAVGEGHFQEAYEIASAPNPLASICGRICGHPCESVCRRGKIDSPIAIRALKRSACEKFGPESGQKYLPRSRPQSNGIKVAVIGAGPSGISCAYYLALNGFEVTMFESTPTVGGMLYLGIPEYRLPRYLIRMEFERILHLGVEIRTGWTLGRDFSIKTLKDQGYAAVYVGIGASQSRRVRLPGSDLNGVINGIDFLINANLGYQVELSERVIVVGGGNVAIDVARSAIRDQNPTETDDGSTTIDAARAALRLGAKEVHIVCLESWDEMPAHRYEVDEAEAEGVIFHTSKGPKEILGRQGNAIGLQVLDVLSVFDREGRFNPTLLPDTEAVIEGGTVILAIGQQVDRNSFALDPELELTPAGTIKTDRDTLETSIPGVFSGGDAVFGPRIAIDSVANGKHAARSIMRHLKQWGLAHTSYHFQTLDTVTYRMPEGYECTARVDVPEIAVDRRVGFAEVELGYTEEQARQEASRCLKCNINTIFDAQKCILCGACVDVCPLDCLRLVRTNRLKTKNASPGEGAAEPAPHSFAIIKDETLCIRCALCAKRCPTRAITMERIVFPEYTNA